MRYLCRKSLYSLLRLSIVMGSMTVWFALWANRFDGDEMRNLAAIAISLLANEGIKAARG